VTWKNIQSYRKNNDDQEQKFPEPNLEKLQPAVSVDSAVFAKTIRSDFSFVGMWFNT
jgi:hypothetical protein